VRVAVGELEGVAALSVSVEDGLARLDLQPDNRLSLARLRHLIEESGFAPREAVVTARAEVQVTGGRLRVTISGVDETFDVEPAAGAAAVVARLKQQAGRRVVIRATVPPPAPGRATPILRVTSAEPAGPRDDE
jgi:hypothetical protein